MCLHKKLQQVSTSSPKPPLPCVFLAIDSQSTVLLVNIQAAKDVENQCCGSLQRRPSEPLPFIASPSAHQTPRLAPHPLFPIHPLVTSRYVLLTQKRLLWRS